MPSVISAGTTAGSAIAITGDTTGNLAFQTNGTTTAMTIDTNQNVGIGTTSPVNYSGYETLTINGSTGGILQLQANGASGLRVVEGTSQVEFFEERNVPMLFATNNIERMRIDSSGRVTTPFQPGCLVGKTNGNVGAQNIVVFDQIIYNVGSHYNNSNGRFTVPITGYYYVSASALGTTSSGIEVSVRRNGGVIVNTRGGGAGGYTSASSSVIFYANANDYFDYKVEGSYTVDGNSGYPYTGMCVYLIG